MLNQCFARLPEVALKTFLVPGFEFILLAFERPILNPGPLFKEGLYLLITSPIALKSGTFVILNAALIVFPPAYISKKVLSGVMAPEDNAQPLTPYPSYSNCPSWGG